MCASCLCVCEVLCQAQVKASLPQQTAHHMQLLGGALVRHGCCWCLLGLCALSMLQLRVHLLRLESLRCLQLLPARTGMYAMQVGMVMAKVRAAINGDAPTALFFKAPTISGGIW